MEENNEYREFESFQNNVPLISRITVPLGTVPGAAETGRNLGAPHCFLCTGTTSATSSMPFSPLLKVDLRVLHLLTSPFTVHPPGDCLSHSSKFKAFVCVQVCKIKHIEECTEVCSSVMYCLHSLNGIYWGTQVLYCNMLQFVTFSFSAFRVCPLLYVFLTHSDKGITSCCFLDSLLFSLWKTVLPFTICLELFIVSVFLYLVWGRTPNSSWKE